MASLGSSSADGAKKTKKKGESSLPNLLSVEISQHRRGSTGAAWPSRGESPRRVGAGGSMSDALLLDAEKGRPRSSSYTAAAANCGSQADANHHTRKESYPHDVDTPRTGGSYAGDDVVDGRSLSADPSHLKADIDQLKSKMQSTMHRIQQEQTANEEKVTWYLSKSEASPSNRAKAEFEKHNQKSANTISHLQKKLEAYRRRLRDVEQRLSSAAAAVPASTGSVTQLPAANHGHGRPGPKGLLRDVGSGLREIRDGVLGSLAVVPYDIRRGVKKMFGSADNLQHLTKSEPVERNTGTRSVAGSGSGHGSTISPPASKLLHHVSTAAARESAAGTQSEDDDDGCEKAPSSCDGLLEDRRSDGDSPLHASASSGQHLRRLQHHSGADDSLAVLEKTQEQLGWATGELAQLKSRLTEMQDEVSPLQERLQEDHYRCIRLEEQLNDISDLYQTEFTNLKQELASVQEKLEYKMEERSRDLQEYIESCHNKISKMELQGQRQQQVLTMEGMSNATERVLATKFANVVLALVAVLLLVASAAKKIMYPFVNSRRKLAGVLVVLIALMLTSSHWHRLTGSAVSSLSGSATTMRNSSDA